MSERRNNGDERVHRPKTKGGKLGMYPKDESGEEFERIDEMGEDGARPGRAKGGWPRSKGVAVVVV